MNPLAALTCGVMDFIGDGGLETICRVADSDPWGRSVPPTALEVPAGAAKLARLGEGSLNPGAQRLTIWGQDFVYGAQVRIQRDGGSPRTYSDPQVRLDRPDQMTADVEFEGTGDYWIEVVNPNAPNSNRLHARVWSLDVPQIPAPNQLPQIPRIPTPGGGTPTPGVPAPTISDISPGTVTAETTTWLDVAGANFVSGFTVKVAGFAIVPSGLQFVSSSRVRVSVRMGVGGAPYGDISPDPVTAETTTWLDVSGASFVSGFTVKVAGFAIDPSGLQFVSSSRVRVSVRMGVGGTPYNATLELTNPDGQRASRTFRVVGKSSP